MSWSDPYVYDDCGVLKNKFGIKNQKELLLKELEIVIVELYTLRIKPLKGDYNFDHLCAMHKQIFGRLFDWAGQPRITNILKDEEILNNHSIQYEDWTRIEDSATKILSSMKAVSWKELDQERQAFEIASHYAQLWRVHPFREGNTRTITNFMIQYLEDQGIFLSRSYFSQKVSQLRDYLVLAAAYYDGTGKQAYLEPLKSMIKKSMERYTLDMERYKNNTSKRKMSMKDYLKKIFTKKTNARDSQNSLNSRNKDIFGKER